jgi:hypothetical protein
MTELATTPAAVRADGPPNIESNTWQKAVNDSQAFLSVDERTRFGNSAPEDIVHDFHTSQLARGQKSKIQIILRKIQPLVAAVERYGRSLDVITNASPEILSPLWGTLRALLVVGTSRLVCSSGMLISPCRSPETTRNISRGLWTC